MRTRYPRRCEDDGRRRYVKGAVNDSENRQTLLYGMGDQHLEVVASKGGADSNARIAGHSR